MRSVAALVSMALVAVSGCTESSASSAAAEPTATPAPAPRTVVAVVDFSGSQTAHAFEEGRVYLEKVVDELGYGDRLVLLEMYRTGSRDSVGRFVREMPTPIRAGAETSFDRRELDAARRAVLNVLPIFFDADLVRTIPTTDLLTTMHIAGEHLRDAGPGERQLLILSDMLQSTPGFEFEGAARMPGRGWIQEQAAEDRMPWLDGACVLVIGADHTTSPGQRVRSFWTEYFDAAGARLQPGNYRLRAPTEVVGC